MKDFNWTKFTRKAAIKADMQTIYDAWSKPSEITKWFLKTANYKDSDGNAVPAETNVEGKSEYTWTWHLYEDTEYGSVVVANGKDNFQFKFAGDCLVEIQLEQLDEYVIVTLSQSNIPTDEKSKQNIRLGCDFGWSFYLVNLKSVYEGGMDLRNKDTNLRPMVNN